MAKNLLIRESHFKETIVWLARHPHLMNSVKAIQIVNCGYIEAAGYLSLYDNSFTPRDLSFSPHVKTTLRDLIYKQHDGKAIWEHIHTDGRLVNFTGFIAFSTQYYMDLLFKICPNIKSAKVPVHGPKGFGLPGPDPLPVFTSDLPMANPDCILITPFDDTSLQVMLDSLESLTISQDLQWTRPTQRELLTSSVHGSNSRIGRPPMTLRGFKKLQHLDVPMQVLGLPDSIHFQQLDEDNRVERIDISARVLHQSPSTKALVCPAKIMPLTLKTLQLRSCGGATFMILDLIGHIPAGTSKFKYIDVFFTTCTRKFIHLCHQAEDEALDYFVILSQLRAMDIEVSFYTGENETTVDMWKELDVMSDLSLEEICMAVFARRQFAVYSEHALNRRGTARIDNFFFMKHAVTHFDLLNSSTSTRTSGSRSPSSAGIDT
jgi:hypothetical protein